MPLWDDHHHHQLQQLLQQAAKQQQHNCDDHGRIRRKVRLAGGNAIDDAVLVHSSTDIPTPRVILASMRTKTEKGQTE